MAIGLCNLTRELLRRGRWDELVKEVRQHLDGLTSRGRARPTASRSSTSRWSRLGGAITPRAPSLRVQAGSELTDDPQDQAAYRTYELLLDRVLGQADPAFVADVERHLDDVVAAYGWRSDNPPFLWSAGLDESLETGDLAAVERLLARLEALGPGHRPPSVTA